MVVKERSEMIDLGPGDKGRITPRRSGAEPRRPPMFWQGVTQSFDRGDFGSCIFRPLNLSNPFNVNYRANIVHKLGVELAGWPSKIAFASPIKLSADEARQIRDSLRSGTIHWVVLTPSQREEVAKEISEGPVRKRKPRNDQGRPRGPREGSSDTEASDSEDDDEDAEEEEEEEEERLTPRQRKSPATSTSRNKASNLTTSSGSNSGCPTPISSVSDTTAPAAPEPNANTLQARMRNPAAMSTAPTSAISNAGPAMSAVQGPASSNPASAACTSTIPNLGAQAVDLASLPAPYALNLPSANGAQQDPIINAEIMADAYNFYFQGIEFPPMPGLFPPSTPSVSFGLGDRGLGGGADFTDIGNTWGGFHDPYGMTPTPNSFGVDSGVHGFSGFGDGPPPSSVDLMDRGHVDNTVLTTVGNTAVVNTAALLGATAGVLFEVTNIEQAPKKTKQKHSDHASDLPVAKKPRKERSDKNQLRGSYKKTQTDASKPKTKKTTAVVA
ncbi:hypothetical protein DFH07DRAFT_946017 [Mycena maculata]|uniref:Uncharacterized protein n=1 Tax=Mycena maculata TaxID=230809 RepID=A0AAD7MPU6_9AGAR|nr:hypothetical protein DFH07DRAFT_946017 [Mycena maculata]